MGFREPISTTELCGKSSIYKPVAVAHSLVVGGSQDVLAAGQDSLVTVDNLELEAAHSLNSVEADILDSVAANNQDCVVVVAGIQGGLVRMELAPRTAGIYYRLGTLFCLRAGER